jgi:hypothetical protein
LAVKGKILGRKLLAHIGTVVTPDTILRWHRLLVAKKWDYSASQENSRTTGPIRRDPAVGRAPGRRESAVGLPSYPGALANLGHQISDTTVGNILKEHGIEPAPDRKRQTTWKTFLQAHWEVLAAIDFTTVEVWTKNGLVTFYVLFVMELVTRRVHFAGASAGPDDRWIKQRARHLTAADEGFLVGKRYILMDRDTKFSEAFRLLPAQVTPFSTA